MGIFNTEDRMREATGKGPRDPVWEPPPPAPEKPVWRPWIVGLIVAAAAIFLITAVALAQPNIAPGTTVSTTGPVTSSTTIETGTLAGQALMWVLSVFGTAVGSLLTGVLYRLFKSAGVDITDKFRARLQEIVVNGLNAGTAAAAAGLAGKGTVTVKQPIIADAVRYVQTHAADTLKALGVDPASDEAVSAIRARIETAIADPTVPTPPVLAPPPGLTLSPSAGSLPVTQFTKG